MSTIVIEIDDAGSGSLIGGTGIGILKKETQEYIFEIIPLNYFQHPYFSEKLYQNYVISIVEKALEKLRVDPKEPLYLCRGYVFDRLRKWLSAKEYSWKSTKITGLLQDKVENSFNQYAIGLGLPKNFIIHARYAFGFHRLFKWVMADFQHRAPLCKSGWKSWQKWSSTPLKKSYGKASRPEYCLKCGKLIYQNEPVLILEYNTNKPWTLLLHKKCSS